MRRLVIPTIVIALVSACGGGGDSPSAPATDAASTEAPGGDTASTEAPTTTEAELAVSAYDFITAREEPLWSEVVDGDYANFDAMSGAATLNEAWARLFAWPFEVPMPDDAHMSYALLEVAPSDAEWGERFELQVVSSMPVDDARALVDGYSNELFAAGLMVESNLSDGDFFTYNFEATDAAGAAGWYSFSITVGPETDIDGATGATEVDFSLQRYVPQVSALDIPFFLRGWMAEAPLESSLDFGGIYVNWSDLVEGGPNSLDVEITFTADQTRWAELIGYFGKEWVQDGLVMQSPYVPDDPESTDYVPMSSFATLGVHGFDLTFERDTSDSTLPMKVRYGVSVGEQM